MPFQSEKQRRYLHANHPEIAKRWERDYANGGILDINESEEIISDDGNDIELTAYNAAFDDPNDLSTGVKSLFRAKDGGNVRLGPHTATDLLAKKNPDGTRSKYQPPGYSGPSGQETRGDTRGRDPDPGGHRERPDVLSTPVSQPSYTPTVTTTRDDGRHHPGVDTPTQIAEQKQLDILQDIERREEEKYDNPLDNFYGKRRTDLKKQIGLDKYNNIRNEIEGKLNQKLINKGLTIAVGVGTLGIGDMLGMLYSGYQLERAKREYLDLLSTVRKEYLDLGIAEHSPHVDTPIQALDQEILDLTQTRDRDDERDDDKGPIYDPVTGAVDEEFAQGEYMQGAIDPRDWMAEIRARQAIYQGLKSGWENQQLNSGGLANLFRVKN